MRNIFLESDFEDIVSRIKLLSPTSTPQWGTMNVAQMLAHANLLFAQALGVSPPEHKVNSLMRPLLKRLILSPKPFKHGLPTGKDFVMTAQEKDFDRERASILANLEEIRRRGQNTEYLPHAAIGKLKPQEWGWIMWKHTDHHLRQFGV